ncbi:MAG: DUF2281 domain-containing protein [Chitinophagales bacterium]
MSALELASKIEALPADLKEEVNDFIDFLSEKKKKKLNSKQIPKAGLTKGLIEMLPAFDDPLDDFKEYM